MLKIRYAVMPDGIRARIDRGHDGSVTTTIILAPDMTPPARRAMLGRLVRNSRIPGYGPPLSGIGVALALGWDVTWTRLRDGATAARLTRVCPPLPPAPAHFPQRASTATSSPGLPE